MADFHPPFLIEQGVDARPSPDTHVVIAIGADVESGLEVFFVKHRLACGALDPKTFRHSLARTVTAVAVDARWKDFVYPAHCSFLSVFDPPGLARQQGQSSTARMPASQSAAACMARWSISCCEAPSCWASLTAASMISMILLPMTTASAHCDRRWALCGSRMPKPTPTGTLTWRRMTSRRRATSSVSR